MKYQGNKQKLVNDFLPVMLDSMDKCSSFVDLFCGSCSVIQKVPDKYVRIANDNNKYLIAMWQALLDGDILPTMISRELYENVKGSVRWDSPIYSDAVKGWVGYMASSEGLFGSYKGHSVKTKTGQLTDCVANNIKDISSQIDELKGVVFQSADYSDAVIPCKSLIYCDPPRKGTKQCDMSKDFDHEKFYDWARQKKEEGHKIFVSEYEMPHDFSCVWEKKGKSVSNRRERLFTL